MSNDPFTFTPEERGFERVSDDDSDALYAADTSRDATGKVDRVEFAARGNERTGFYAQKVQRNEAGQIVGKQTFGTKKDTREDAVESVEKQVRGRTAANFGGFTIGEFNVGDDSNIALARRAHLSRSKEAQASDAAKRAPVTTNASRYASQPGELDYPGVDTPSTDPNVLPKDLRQKQRPAATDPPDPPQRRTQPPDTPSNERNTQAPEPLTTGLAKQDVSLSPEEAFEGVGSGSSEGAFFGTGSRVDEQRRLESGDPPDIARGEDPFDMSNGGGALDE